MTSQDLTPSIHRRDFIKLVGVGMISALFTPASSAKAEGLISDFSGNTQTRFGNFQVRGTWKGQILKSTDNGKTWHAIASFGEHCSVSELVVQSGVLYAKLKVAGHSFRLRTTDMKTWHTIS